MRLRACAIIIIRHGDDGPGWTDSDCLSRGHHTGSRRVWMMMHMESHLAQRSGPEIFLEAMKEGNVQLAQLILGDAAANASLDSVGAAGRTLLMCASLLPRTSERTCFTQLLLGHGVDVERQDEAGRTALSLASEHGYLDAVRPLVHHGADPGSPDKEGRSPLDYAVMGRHDNVARFLLNELQCRKEQIKTSGQRNGSCSDCPVSGGFSQGASHSLRRTMGYVFLIDQVICNPYVPDKQQESRYNYQKSGNTVPPPNSQLCDRHDPEEKPPPPLKDHPGTSKSGFLPTWMRKSSVYHSNLSSVRANKPSGIFSKWMASKAAPSVSSSLHDLLNPDGEVMDSTKSSASIHLSEKRLQNTLTDTILQNRCFLDESSQWMQPTEGFLTNCYERWDEEELYPDHIKRNKLPRDFLKCLSRMHNAMQLLSQSEQNSAHSSCNVFRALRRCTNLELKFLHVGKEDPEQEALVREQHANSTE